MHVTVGSMGKG